MYYCENGKYQFDNRFRTSLTTVLSTKFWQLFWTQLTIVLDKNLFDNCFECVWQFCPLWNSIYMYMHVFMSSIVCALKHQTHHTIVNFVELLMIKNHPTLWLFIFRCIISNSVGWFLRGWLSSRYQNYPVVDDLVWYYNGHYNCGNEATI